MMVLKQPDLLVMCSGGKNIRLIAGKALFEPSSRQALGRQIQHRSLNERSGDNDTLEPVSFCGLFSVGSKLEEVLFDVFLLLGCCT